MWKAVPAGIACDKKGGTGGLQNFLKLLDEEV
jgi:hypothetical protein